MADYVFVYSQQNDFPNHKADIGRLQQEVERSVITVAIDYISASGDTISLHFKADLDVTNKAALDALVAAHSGEPLPPMGMLVSLDGPATNDGKPIFLSNMFPSGVFLYITGAADDVASATGRGDGASFMLASDVAGDESLDFQFADWVFLAGGGIQAQGGQVGDHVSLEIYAPATPVVANASGAGNCNLVDPGVGQAILIVPAAGDGTHDVDLSQAVPIPASNDDAAAGTGYYEWSAPDAGKGLVLVSSTPGRGKYNLFTVQNKLARFVNRYPLRSDQYIDLTVVGIKPHRILPHWHFVVSMHNAGHAGLKVSWNLVAARAATT